MLCFELAGGREAVNRFLRQAAPLEALPGVPFSKDPGGKGPLSCLGLFVNGSATLKAGGRDYNLAGRNRVVWTNESAGMIGPESLPKLPDWWSNTVDPNKSSDELKDVLLTLKDLHATLSK